MYLSPWSEFSLCFTRLCLPDLQSEIKISSDCIQLSYVADSATEAASVGVTFGFVTFRKYGAIGGFFRE
jgi:hypothetical protein